MALARLALKNLSQRITSSSSYLSSSSLVSLHRSYGERSLVQRQKFGDREFLRRFMATTAGDQKAASDSSSKKSEGKEVAVKKVGKKLSKLFPWRRGGRRGGGGGGLWRRNDDRDFVPLPSTLYEIFPSGLGNALMEATENINRLFDNINITPNQLMPRVKEKDDCYKVRYDVPRIAKEDVKIMVEDGVLTIKGEHKQEEEEGSESDDEYWSASSYGYYNTSLVLPDDAKVDDIKAEMKDGVLTVVIPRTENAKKDVKEVMVD